MYKRFGTFRQGALSAAEPADGRAPGVHMRSAVGQGPLGRLDQLGQFVRELPDGARRVRLLQQRRRRGGGGPRAAQAAARLPQGPSGPRADAVSDGQVSDRVHERDF